MRPEADRATATSRPTRAARALNFRTTMREKAHLLLLVGVVVAGVGAAFLLRGTDRHALVFFGDATSHLVIARRVVDWADNPGLVQLGTSWLPLPHLLFLPFTLIEPLFTTGFAGAVVGLPCLAGTTALLCRTLEVHLAAPTSLAVAGASLYALNPNIGYLGLVAMTEAPFMLFFVASAYLLQRWYVRPDDVRALALAALCTAAATLCRYEGWVLPPLLVAVVAWRLARAALGVRRNAACAALALLSLAGILVWVAYNAVLYGDPLEFANAEYYSAASQAKARDIRETLLFQPWNVVSVYGTTALTVYGPFLLAAALLGYVLGRRSPDGGSRGPLLAFLALPALFTLVLLLVGIGEMTLWFNSRFLVLLGPLLIVLAVVFVQRVSTSRARRRAWTAGTVGACLAFSGWMVLADTVPTYLDARVGFAQPVTLSAFATGDVLAAGYDGGRILVMTGSPQEHRIMVSAGIPLAEYDEILEWNTGKAAFREPWLHDRWLVLSKVPDADGVSAVAYWRERRDQLDDRYRTIYENEHQEIMVRIAG